MQADKWLHHFNARFNPSGNLWVDSSKRPAESPADGDEAITLPKLTPDDPETMEELSKKTGAGLKQGLTTLQTGLLAAKTPDGAIYLYAETDMVASKGTPLQAWGAGKWLIDKELKAAEDKNASALVPFKCNNATTEFRFFGKPPFTDAAFSTNPQSLHEFLQYLEKTHAVTEHNLVNHAVERTDGDGPPQYTVKEEVPCKYMTSGKASDKNFCAGTAYDKISASERVTAMIDIEWPGKHC